MKLRSLLGGACTLILVACGGGDQEATAGEPADVTPVVDEGAVIAELTDYYQTHYNMHHASMVADTYVEDGVFLSATGRVLEGREAITGYLQEGMDAMSPELTIDQADQVIAGNHAVARGTYSLAGVMEGEATGFSGAFINLLEKTGDEWQIVGTVTNYDSDAYTELYEGPAEGMEPPPEEGTLTALYEAWETHHNLGHASMVADLYTEDAQVAFPYNPWISGREAISAYLEEGLEGSPQLDIHGVETVDLGNGLFADAGWWEVTVEGDAVRSGNYALLAEQNAEGEARIRWHVINGSPPR